LVLTRHSALAPYSLQRRVVSQIAGSAVLTYESDAHIAYFNSPCVVAAEQQYLITGVRPPAGASC
jgi:hypothetical protein